VNHVLLAHSYYLRYDPKQTRKMKPYPPLSTLITASILRREGVPFTFFDSMLAGGVGEFANRLRDVRPAVVGILEDNFNFLTKMCTTRMREAAFEMIGLAKAAGAWVAVNGSDAADQTAAYLAAGADAVIVGETEVTFPELVRYWTSDRSAAISEIPGLVLPGGPTARRMPVADLDALPLPAWDLVDIARYRAAWTDAHGRFSWNMCASRGCPFGCNWCSKPMFGRRYTQRTAAGVAVELAELRRTVRPDHVWFADDIFGLTSHWLQAFAEKVVALGAATPFTMQSRVDLMTEAAVSALAAAGAEEVWLGVESASQTVLDEMNKGSTVEQVRDATRRLKRHGIRACWFIQLGYPGEHWNDIVLTRDLIRDERPDDIGVSVAYPLPGTEFFDRVHAELRAKTNWSDSDDLAMMFRGAYTTDFYREIRTLLHEEVEARTSAGEVAASWSFDARWDELAHREESHRTDEGRRRSLSRRIAYGG
jgi:anaerobic magnesium-protoporphyrin IX monomethyl ester cyclase